MPATVAGNRPEALHASSVHGKRSDHGQRVTAVGTRENILSP
jgi:hypothetical protein